MKMKLSNNMNYNPNYEHGVVYHLVLTSCAPEILIEGLRCASDELVRKYHEEQVNSLSL